MFQRSGINFFYFIIGECNNGVIFLQNLGAFDGFFLYKALSNKFKAEEVTCLIDSENKLSNYPAKR